MAEINRFILEGMGSALVIEAFMEAVSEKALLIYDNAPDAELRNVQRKVDMIQEEILRRMSW